MIIKPKIVEKPWGEEVKQEINFHYTIMLSRRNHGM